MKVLLAAMEGDMHFGILNDLPIDGLEIVHAKTPDDIRQHIVDADVMYGFPNDALLATATKLKWLQSPGAGVDWVTRLDRLVNSDIIVTNTSGAHGPSIAEHVFAFLLTFTRRVPRSLEWQSQKHWGREVGYRDAEELNGKTMGVVGFGQIGQQVAKRAAAFDMDVIAVDAYATDGKGFAREVWRPERLKELAARSYALVVAVPFTPETHNLINADIINAMPKGSYLVAISRGGIVDEAALLEGLQSGHLAGAGIDVTEVEPLPADNPLWDAPNLLITPHTAGASTEKELRCVQIFKDNLLAFSKGEPLKNVIDKQRGY